MPIAAFDVVWEFVPPAYSYFAAVVPPPNNLKIPPWSNRHAPNFPDSTVCHPLDIPIHIERLSIYQLELVQWDLLCSQERRVLIV